MPRVTGDKLKYMQKDFLNWVFTTMREKKITQEQLGKMMGVTQSGFSNRLKKGVFTYMDMLILFQVLGASEADIVKHMKA